MNVPNHVAIIMDGNGRWAKSKGMPRNYGHLKGSANVEKIVQTASDMGVKYLTVYAFSTENWNRPEEEVSALMGLMRDYLKTCIRKAPKNNMRVRILGSRDGLSEEIRALIDELEETTKIYTKINFQIAINYGSRDEILRAVRKIAADTAGGTLKTEDITAETFSSYLDTRDIPDPDLLIRTSGESRISNFLLWQLAYTELYFTDVPWPAFTKKELTKAIEDYNTRQRRFGKL